MIDYEQNKKEQGNEEKIWWIILNVYEENFFEIDEVIFHLAK